MKLCFGVGVTINRKCYRVGVGVGVGVDFIENAI